MLTFHFWDSTKITNNKLKLKHVVKMVHVMSVEGIQRKTRETLLDSGGHTWISYFAERWGNLDSPAWLMTLSSACVREELYLTT